MNQKNNSPMSDNQYLEKVFNDILNESTDKDKKIPIVIKEEIKPSIVENTKIDENSTNNKSFDEITDELIKEGWFDRFMAKSKGEGAKIGTDLSNTANKIKTGASNIKGGIKNVANTTKNSFQGKTTNPDTLYKPEVSSTTNSEHEQIKSTIQSIYVSSFKDAINDMVKLGLILPTNVGTIDKAIRITLSTKISDILRSENKLKNDESVIITNSNGNTIIKNTPITIPQTIPIGNKPLLKPQLNGNNVGTKTQIPTKVSP